MFESVTFAAIGAAILCFAPDYGGILFGFFLFTVSAAAAILLAARKG